MADPKPSPHPRNGKHGPRESTAKPSGLYDLPLLGGLIERADRLRMGLPGSAFARQEADFLRFQSRSLRFLANALDQRAKQLERLEKEERGDTPRLERIQVD